MGRNILNDCVGCPQGCAHCGRDRDYIEFFCDRCKEEKNVDKGELYYFNGKELCIDCIKESLMSKILDDMDDSLCEKCGYEADELYYFNGEWVCEECLMEMLERVEG